MKKLLLPVLFLFLLWITNAADCSIEWSNFNNEQNEAFVWACENQIISIHDINIAELDKPLTRIDMANMFSNYWEKVLWLLRDNTRDCHWYKDLTIYAESETASRACQLWIMWVWIEDFRPYDIVSRAEFWTALSRVLFWDKYNSTEWDWYSKHLNALKEEWIITNTNPDMQEMRWWVMLMMMRSQDKAKELNEITETEIVDITVSDWTDTISIMDRNLWAKVSWTWTNSYWNYYIRWNNTPVNKTNYGTTLKWKRNDWTQWPCPDWYHIPTTDDWHKLVKVRYKNLYNNKKWPIQDYRNGQYLDMLSISNWYTWNLCSYQSIQEDKFYFSHFAPREFIEYFKLPQAWYFDWIRVRDDWKISDLRVSNLNRDNTFYNQTNIVPTFAFGYSTTNCERSNNKKISTIEVKDNTAYTKNWLPIRCFKD
jgi:hypothetical protein